MRARRVEQIRQQLRQHALQSGKTVERFIEAPKGSASRPFTVDDHVTRFTQEMRKRFPDGQVDALLEEVRGFARAANAGRLMQMLARQKYI